MPTIRIPQEHWGQVWRALVATGPIARQSQEPVYHISEKQLRLLQRKRLPFELVVDANGQAPDTRHG